MVPKRSKAKLNVCRKSDKITVGASAASIPAWCPQVLTDLVLIFSPLHFTFLGSGGSFAKHSMVALHMRMTVLQRLQYPGTRHDLLSFVNTCVCDCTTALCTGLERIFDCLVAPCSTQTWLRTKGGWHLGNHMPSAKRDIAQSHASRLPQGNCCALYQHCMS